MDMEKEGDKSEWGPCGLWEVTHLWGLLWLPNSIFMGIMVIICLANVVHNMDPDGLLQSNIPNARGAPGGCGNKVSTAVIYFTLYLQLSAVAVLPNKTIFPSSTLCRIPMNDPMWPTLVSVGV